jgi:hypothetical protein
VEDAPSFLLVELPHPPSPLGRRETGLSSRFSFSSLQLKLGCTCKGRGLYSGVAKSFLGRWRMRVKEAVKVLQKFVGKDISHWWKHYRGGDFPTSYKLRKANNREVIVYCYQNGKVWSISLRPSVFLQKVDKDYAPEELVKVLS